jgi:peptidoglycan DL-endopeptidase LytE
MVFKTKGGCMLYSIRIAVICLIVLTFPAFAFASKTHRMKKNETLHSLAKRYHVTLSDLKSANNLVSNQVKPGAIIIIPPRSAAAGSDGAVKGSAALYKVRKGDTLARIAKKTGVSVSELKRINSLGKRVKPGQVLALKDSNAETDATPRLAKKVQLRYNDLFSEKDYEQSLAELTDPDPAKPVDLTKNLELKTDNVKMLKSTAYGFLGTRYRFGGSSRSGIDCSSFVQKVFRELEVSLPRTAREQFEIGNEVAPGDLQKGDLIFFRTYASYPSHVGIYLGNNRMIHASSRDRRVVISPMNTPYYRSRFIGAKRIAKINPSTFKFDDLIAGIEEETAEDTQVNDTLGLSLAN